jgi:putative transcriptional regulator
MTVVETPGFLRDATAALSAEERTEMISFLAANPDAGDIMPGTGGTRKLRWRAQGRGTRGGVRVIYYSHKRFAAAVSAQRIRKEREGQPDKGRTERNADPVAPFGCGLPEKDGAMKAKRTTKPGRPGAGSRIIASLKEAVDWVEGRESQVRVTTVEVPSIDVRATRQRLRLSQAAFAAKFGFQPATLRNWEQGRTRPDGPARVLLAVIARHPEAVEDALRKVS